MPSFQPADAFLLFALGRLVSKKGVQGLLRAIRRVPAETEGRPLVLLIAGDGPCRDTLHRLASDLGVGQRVRWAGWQDRPDLFYASADAFVCPSRHEPFGVVQVEAWNYRLPVISTATDGALELVEDGVNALLCEVANSRALSEQIRALLSASPAHRKSLGEAGYRLLQRRFSREAILEQYLSLYRNLTGIRRT